MIKAALSDVLPHLGSWTLLANDSGAFNSQTRIFTYINRLENSARGASLGRGLQQLPVSQTLLDHEGVKDCGHGPETTGRLDAAPWLTDLISKTDRGFLANEHCYQLPCLTVTSSNLYVRGRGRYI